MSHKSFTLVVPVYNEEDALKAHIPLIVEFLAENFKETEYRVVIADNASTDGTQKVSEQLASQHDVVEYLRIDRKGRGYALKQAWSQAETELVAYCDVDLSTPLEYLIPLFKCFNDEQVTVATGSRLMKGSKVIGRRPFREVTSRVYNFILQFVAGAKFKDAQCGFKAARTKTFKEYEPLILNNNWFFDSELLLLNQYDNNKIGEVPIVWTDDPNSTVNVTSTVIEDLKGTFRMYFKHFPNSWFYKFISFGLIGGLSTIGQALLFYALRDFTGPQISNFIALVLMTILNTTLNRVFTFKNKTFNFAKEIRINIASFLIYLTTTSVPLYLLHEFFPSLATRELEAFIVVVASLVGTVLKFGLFHFAFGRRKKEIA